MKKDALDKIPDESSLPDPGKHRKKKSQIIYMTITIFTCFSLFVFASVAWFVLNHYSEAQRLLLSAAGLDEFVYNANLEYLDSSYEWEEIDELNYDMNPGEFILVKLTMENKEETEKKFKLAFSKLEINYYGLYEYPKAVDGVTLADGYGQEVFWGGEYYTTDSLGEKADYYDYHNIGADEFYQFVSPVSDAIRFAIVPEETIHTLTGTETTAQLEQITADAEAYIKNEANQVPYLSDIGTIEKLPYLATGNGIDQARANEWIPIDSVNAKSKDLLIGGLATKNYFLMLYYDPDVRVSTEVKITNDAGDLVEIPSLILDNSNPYEMERLRISGMNIRAAD